LRKKRKASLNAMTCTRALSWFLLFWKRSRERGEKVAHGESELRESELRESSRNIRSTATTL
jgi:hypothetical protein